ncbi:MAG: hypothetical protein RMI88_05865 [Nitrososphaerota archaeon]|nr:hypothetical protein [Nitrososphaerota archaeon]
MVRLRFSGEGFYLDRLSRWYVEDRVRRRLGGRYIDILVSEKGWGNIINIPLRNKDVEMWIVEKDDKITVRIVEEEKVEDITVWEKT